MKKSSKIVVLCLNALLCALIVPITLFFLGGWGDWVKAACYAIAAAGVVFSVVTFVLKKDALFKSGFVIVACAFVVIAVVALISALANLDDYGSDAEKMDKLTEVIRGTGNWGMAVYVLIQVLQVVILPLPAAVCYIPGSLIWGPWISTLLASLGVIIGSVISYFIGRLFGKRVVIWIAGKETTEKYAAYIGSRGKVIFVLMQILPFFPDDILCMIAGLTSMNFAFFAVSIIVVRPFIIAAYCFLGSGTVIPFSGWGIPVWILIFAVCIALAVLSFKYQDVLEKWLVQKFRRKAKDGNASLNCGGRSENPATDETDKEETNKEENDDTDNNTGEES